MESVELISYSTSCHDPTMSLLDMVAYCARVSNPSNQSNTLSNHRLISYLIRNKHWSPFEMVNICISITTTRDIARQILRHRSFSFQEFSQRYANPSLDFETREPRLQDMKNRQNSIEVENPILQNQWETIQNDCAKNAKEAYEWAIENGIAKEQARCILPEGMTPSTLYMNGTLRSWIHYLEIRMSKETQKEHRIVAEKCYTVIRSIFPLDLCSFAPKSLEDVL
jgi:thymidylate synthase (FAD)